MIQGPRFEGHQGPRPGLRWERRAVREAKTAAGSRLPSRLLRCFLISSVGICLGVRGAKGREG